MKNKYTTIGDTAYILLTQGQVAIIDKVDMELVGDYKWYAHNKPNSFYALSNRKTSNGQCKVKMHRLILGLTDPEIIVDHINHNGLDNCRSNLRICTNAQNHMNRKSHKGVTSKYKGVCWHKRHRKWISSIKHKDKGFHLGYFKNEEEAANAYNKKAVELFGSFANINKV